MTSAKVLDDIPPQGVHVSALETAFIREVAETKGGSKFFAYGHSAMLARAMQDKGLALVSYMSKGVRVTVTLKGDQYVAFTRGV